jgi:hypothetical protein
MARNSSLLNSLRASPDPIARKAAEAIEGVSQEVDALRRSVAALEAPAPPSAVPSTDVIISYVN